VSYYERYATDARIEARQSKLFRVDDKCYSFADSGNTFRCFTAEPYGNFVALASDRETFMELAAHYECGSQGDLDVRGRCSWNSGGVFIIGVFDGKLSTLVHETGHAAIGILERAGLRINTASDEAFCYLQTRMFEAFETAL
jgi:hypothetical protein